MKDTKIKLKKTVSPLFIRFVSFVLVFLILLVLTSQIITPKYNKDLMLFNAGGILSLPKNSLDYVVIGNSNAVEGFSPLDIWHSFGYAGYACGEPWQNTTGSYYMLKMILETQAPKVVILDTDTLYERKTMVSSLENDFTLVAQFYFSIFRYHNNWKKLAPWDFLMNPNYTWHHADYGHMVNKTVNAYSGNKYMASTTKLQPLTPQMEYYLDQIVSLCREKNIALILVSIPSPTYWNTAEHNAVSDYASGHGISYIDLNLNTQDYGLDWATDTRDRGEHLNCYGAQKVSNYIGQFILENYSLPDHLGDPAYAQWDKDYANYIKYIGPPPAS